MHIAEIVIMAFMFLLFCFIPTKKAKKPPQKGFSASMIKKVLMLSCYIFYFLCNIIGILRQFIHVGCSIIVYM